MGSEICPCLPAFCRFELLVTAAAVSAVAVAPAAGPVGLPQGADSQCHNACQYQQNDNFSRGHSLFPPYCAAATEVSRRVLSSP